MKNWNDTTLGGKRAFIIAEIGKNQIQSAEDRPVAEYLENAKELARLAVESGADCVKFQTHWVHDEQLQIDVTSPHFKGSDRYSWVRRNMMSTPFHEFWVPLKDYVDGLGVPFLSTPMSKGAAWLLSQLDVKLWKMGSGDMLDFVTLDFIARTGKPLIFSSGMSSIEETQKAIAFLKKRKVDMALLHCVSQYPCPPEELRLSTIEYYKEIFPDVTIGFSDHSIGFESAVAARALGAVIIEKHFSSSRDHWGSDHKVSMLPGEFREMVDSIRALEADPAKKDEWLSREIVIKGMGDKNKTMDEKEQVFRGFFRKSLMAGQDMPAGTVITEDMLYAMRPQAYAGGLPSEEYENILGKTIIKDLKKYDPVTADVFG